MFNIRNSVWTRGLLQAQHNATLRKPQSMITNSYGETRPGGGRMFFLSLSRLTGVEYFTHTAKAIPGMDSSVRIVVALGP